MSLMLFDFECEDGHRFEELVKSGRKTINCHCGKKATRQISVPHFATMAMGVSPDFPSAARKWDKSQYQRAKTDKGGLAHGAPNLKMY